MFLPTQPLLVLSTALKASALTLRANPCQVHSPPRRRPKSLSRRPWASRGAGNRVGHASSLRAYTVADTGSDKSWLPIFKFPTSFVDFLSDFGTEDSLLSFEGGGVAEIAAKPCMPNLESEAAAIMATKAKDVNLNIEKDELLFELNSLTKKFEDLQSSMDYKSQLYSETIKGYECTVGILEDQNALLEEGLSVLTANLEEQDQQLKKLLQVKEHTATKEREHANENEMLRRRLHQLELELSDVAFASRKVARPTTSIEEPNKMMTVTPKAPSVPMPSHLYQQHHQVGQVQLLLNKYKMEPFSVLARGIKKAGRMLKLWSPIYNAFLWGKLRGN